MGIASGWLISLPRWGILAAVALTIATIGMLAGLLWLFRRSWADKTWPPGGSGVPNPARTRRVSLIVGFVMLALIPAFVTLAIVRISSGDVDVFTAIIWLLQACFYGAWGVMLLRVGLGRVRSDDTESK